jgi:ribosome-binding factor A
MVMQEGKRQKQVAALLMEELSGVFRKLGLNMIDGGMVSISSVKITPDLFEAKIYLSLFQVKDARASMAKITERSWEIKRELVSSIKHQLRIMPQLNFFLDNSLEYVDKMEDLFRKIKEEQLPSPPQADIRNPESNGE